jgi:hypothetical protein
VVHWAADCSRRVSHLACVGGVHGFGGRDFFFVLEVVEVAVI